MINSTVIRILISCPDDVLPEKKEIIRLCKTFSTTNIDTSSIVFEVKDWRDYIGGYGKLPQDQLNEYFGDYDIYIGILWKRFGAKPGSFDKNGKENESGTEDEFNRALEKWEKHKRPQIKFFFKTYNRVCKSKEESEQLTLVFKFLDEQKKSFKNFVNEFDSKKSFNDKIISLLLSIQNSVSSDKIKGQKQLLKEDDISVEIERYNSYILPLPTEYIERDASHFSTSMDIQTSYLLKPERQSLDQIIIEKNRVVLLGDAGSGKSTELRNVFFKLSDNRSQVIPLIQNLNIYTPDKSIEDFLPPFWTKIPQNLLVVILDGLDEIQPEHFNSTVRQIISFSDKYKDIRILISCRSNFYELPINHAPGTLPGFEPYIINDLGVRDIKNFYQLKHISPKGNEFIREVDDNNLIDLIAKPFFLMLMAENFAINGKLSNNRTELYEMFLMNRFDLDKMHFRNTIDIKNQKQKIIRLLEKVAISLEILSKNNISELEILEILEIEEFNILKYCTAFKKKDGEEDVWQFEHNNIQEYLAARALSRLPFEQLIKFITFEPGHKKLIPSWVNTLSFLFNLFSKEDETFKELLEWILVNEKEIVIKFEPDKLPENLRNKIFQEIFNYYKKNDVWISSNKFKDTEFAKFGQSETSIKFLINQIKEKKNSRTVKINAMHIIGHFEFGNAKLKDIVERLLLSQVKNHISDHNYIHTIVHALKYMKLTSKHTIDSLMQIVGKSDNRYIRASMYSILSGSNSLDDYIEYVLEGYSLTDKREGISLMDEGFFQTECIKKIKSPYAIKKLIERLTEDSRFYYSYDSDEQLEKIFDNAVLAYRNDNSVFDTVLDWFLITMKSYKTKQADVAITFFNKTENREKAFYKLWENKNDAERDKLLAIAKLITDESMQFIIAQYIEHNLTNKEIESIYFNMNWAGNDLFQKFGELIKEKTNCVIQIPKQIDYDALRIKKINEEFKLLFDRSDFLKETLRIFDEENKLSFSYDELFEIRKENRQDREMEDYYSAVTLGLLRDFIKKGEFVKKEQIIEWFTNEGRDENYRIYLIHEYLSNHKDLEINNEQIEWIRNWCNENINSVDFRKSIKVNKDGTTTFTTWALYIWYFSRRFKFTYPKEILLDMLSFDFFEGTDWIGIDYLTSKLDANDIKIRMLENMRLGIPDNTVLKNHIKYLSQHKVTESYKLILAQIVNTKRTEYHRKDFLNLFFESTHDTTSLKAILKKADPDIKWEIIDKLINYNEKQFIENYLLKELSKGTSIDEKRKTAEVLIKLENITGLKEYVKLIKAYPEKEDNDKIGKLYLKHLKSKETIPYLMELLEFSYTISIGMYDSLNSRVIEALYNLALTEDNFEYVKTNLQKFRNEKLSLHPNVKYLLPTIERLDEQFYMNRARSYTIEQVKEKLKLIEKA